VSQDSEQQKDVNFVSIRYFLVEASMDVFFYVLFHHLHGILIVLLRSRYSKEIWSEF